jgi:hypothetical protein
MSGCPAHNDGSGSDPNEAEHKRENPDDCENGRNKEAAEDVLETGHPGPIRGLMPW